MAEASTSSQASSSSSNKQNATDYTSPYDKLSRDEANGIKNYNERIIREQFAQGVEVSKSVYLQQVLAEQQQIEARLAMLEQQPEDRDGYLNSLPPLPEYILSVKARASQRPVVLHGRNHGMSLEEAAMIERKHAELQKKRPPRPKDFGGLSEKEKHSIIMEYMNHKDSDDDDEYDEEEDEREYWYDDGKLADDDDTGAVGGEWVDSNDIAHVIAVDRDRIAAGGYYTNFVDDP
ncbi:hypothetical protein M408DRAFT_331309 [Serendipita vermifera MAFF 305830]|uniref:Uncharacterized protein n=1 Tax=Serendipita vermifera MAFF 305830 TaxID=933852 RepID=A0A0C2X7H3_SERVB|nr:hypothetical protein M408DRAFT_331309 [Serendipita vermifera MAFF 305830]